MPYRLQRQRNGALAVHNTAYAETMHPGAGPWAEATRLYVAGSGLEALLTAPGPAQATPVVVFDVGLGAAANALAALACRADLERRGVRPRPLHLVSFEADPAGARFALDEAAALGYPRGHEDALRALLQAGRAGQPGAWSWELRLGDFPRLVRDEPARADVFFFDPFSPHANPEMWRLSTLEALYHCRRRQGPGRLVTYSTAFGTRAGLLLAGFFVGEGPPVAARRGARHGGTVAAAWLGELERPLTPGWLARWRHDREPWPPLTPPGEHRRLRQALAEHPQWAHFEQNTAATPDAASVPHDRPRRGPPGGRGRAGRAKPHARAADKGAVGKGAAGSAAPHRRPRPRRGGKNR